MIDRLNLFSFSEYHFVYSKICAAFLALFLTVRVKNCLTVESEMARSLSFFMSHEQTARTLTLQQTLNWIQI